ncbi:MAG: polysaccharide deacetylase family protein [Deltaproteobacteria bacterium]|nr:polysaccharide deacetylase family protein [Deltaproteobacteria bacterium]MBN2670757.1 polysaccharide deacetylase family protein [Deltaproteobacteria bacterium]
MKRFILFLKMTMLIGAMSISCQKSPSKTASSAASLPPIDGCPTGKAIVSLTYDDGLASQLQYAVSALNEFGLKGTFFLNDVSAQKDDWKKVRDAGHELGAHTLHHPCTASFDWVEAGNASEDYDMPRMAAELDSQLALLRELGQAPPVSFAYPCGTTWIGKEQTSYIPLIQERFLAARGVEGNISVRPAPLMNVPAYFLEGPVEAFIGSANAAIEDSGWVVFGFHGVGGDYLTVSNDDHRAFLQWLVEHKENIAVLPFGEAARCMQ